MFFVAALISVFALFAAESMGTHLQKKEESKDIYNNTFRAVRRSGPLYLLWYSNELNGSLTECLRSQFLGKTSWVSHRTFEINEKPDNHRTYSLQKTNISIIVKKAGKYATVAVTDDEGKFEPRWTEEHQVLNATTHCFVLQAVLIQAKPWKSQCVVFGEKSSHSQECFEMARKDCTNGTKVDLSQCEVVKRNKKEVPRPEHC
ncbi:uncharacterized protein LOC144100185 [Amblyomma americanum]